MFLRRCLFALIGLITDYGYKDPYVGVMKAVIKSINPSVEIIDITHGVERHNVLEAAVNLLVSAPFLPRGSIIIVVVDPGVGSGRRALLVKTRNYVVIGPDNGFSTLLVEHDGFVKAYDISNSKYRLSRVSHTFHGRDVFAPVAAWVSLGVPIEDTGVEVDYSSLVKLEVAKPIVLQDNSIQAMIVNIDVFGNIMTLIDKKMVDSIGLNYGDEVVIETKNGVWRGVFEKSFSLTPPGSIVSYINSWGYLEIAINMGNASQSLGLKISDFIVLRKGS